MTSETLPPAFLAAYRLDGKTALVTGGGSGIGLAVAKCLAASGARVVIAGRRAEALDAAVAESGGAFLARTLDISRLETVAPFATALEREVGPIDILVNNAGNNLKKPFLETTAADLDGIYDVHVRGALELTRAVVRGQVERGGGGVIFIASMASFLGLPLVIGYTAAKSAIVGIVRGLSAEVAPHGVRVNAVAPGWIDTAMFRRATEEDPARREKVMGRIQAKRLGTTDDVGWACAFLASPAASYVTGQTLVVDGGGVVGF
jgi:NAD(P)-dependent dehydrogenase (short-subunit alcohol dehydrogenase family)